jgi:hypothetical protein
MDEFASLSGLRRYLNVADDETKDDEKLLDYLFRASTAIRQETKRDFLPERKTLFFDLPDKTQQLRTETDILEVKGLSHMNGASSINGDNIILSRGCDYNLTPYNNITLPDDSGSIFNFIGTEQQAIHLDAIVGYHERYPREAWIDTKDTLQASATSSTNLIAITASGASNARGFSPRFITQQYLRVGEEYMYVQGIQNASQLNVVRGVRGTTAASHASGITIESFKVEPEIEFLTLRLAGWSYTQESDPYRATLAAPQFGTIELPQTWPPDVKMRLKKYKVHTLLKAY